MLRPTTGRNPWSWGTVRAGSCEARTGHQARNRSRPARAGSAVAGQHRLFDVRWGSTAPRTPGRSRGPGRRAMTASPASTRQKTAPAPAGSCAQPLGRPGCRRRSAPPNASRCDVRVAPGGLRVRQGCVRPDRRRVQRTSPTTPARSPLWTPHSTNSRGGKRLAARARRCSTWEYLLFTARKRHRPSGVAGVRWRGGGGATQPEAQFSGRIFPLLITNRTSSRRRTSSSGSPSTAMRSAR